MACFYDASVSQGSVAIHARYGEILNIRLTANLPRNLPVKKILNRFTFDRTVAMSLWHACLEHPVDNAGTARRLIRAPRPAF